MVKKEKIDQESEKKNKSSEKGTPVVVESEDKKEKKSNTENGQVETDSKNANKVEEKLKVEVKEEKSTGSVNLTPKKYQHGKKHRKASESVEKGREYELSEAITLIKKTANTKFDATVEIHINLNVDPSNADHQIRGSVSLPAGLGKSKNICAVVSAEKEKETKDAGADTVGGQELIEKIEKGWMDFDVVVATPDMMSHLGKIGKILGTKGLMPNPKSGTVSQDPGKVISEIKKGRAEYKIDKQGSLHSAVGKVSFKEEDLKTNLEAYLDVIHHSKPASLKGAFIKSIYLTTTMGPSVKIVK